MALKEWLISHADEVGYLAILFCSVSYVPQIMRIYKNKSSKDVSFLMFAFWITGSSIWLAYGLVEKLKPIIATNLINLTFRLWVLGTKIVMDHKNGCINAPFLNRFTKRP